MSAETESMVAAWADKIRQHLQAARSHAELAALERVNAGHALIRAKDELSHGSWLHVLAKVGMHPRMAQMLMQVARHPVISDAKRVSQLPAAIRTRVVLARFDEDEAIAAIESGEIHPEMTRTDAEAVVRRRRPRLTPAQRDVLWGQQGRIRDPAADAASGAASLFRRAIRYRDEHGIRFPDAELKALDEIEAALAAYRTNPRDAGTTGVQT